MPDDVAYRERLWPSPWVFLSTALVIPASLLVFLPISPPLGVVAAVILYAAILVVLLATTATIEVTASTFRAGRAHIERRLISAVHAYQGADATAERGVRLDARAWLLVRGWIPGVVRVELADPEDPTPYWVVSSRRPDELAAALSSGG
ncbi:MAG TPA: DUF3093 domain-containing protein [Pseudolysinimonas sp.]|jgi:hypothetical protein|nr:DUF3093 domain-containing protein [Pseudolysinimonas sp.]